MRGKELKTERLPTARADTSAAFCTAVAEGYSAVSHGNVLYLYGEKDGAFWQTYTHAYPISQMQFGANGDLYFLDEQSILYRLNTATYLNETATPAQNTGITGCGVFHIDDENLYYTQSKAQNTLLYRASLTDLTIKEEIYTANVPPHGIFMWEQNFYLLFRPLEDNLIYRLSLNETPTLTKIATLNEPYASFAIIDGVFYGLTADGKLYRNPLTDFSSATQETGSFTALSAYNGKIYLLSDGEVKTYSKTEGLQKATGAFTAPLLADLSVEALKSAYENGDTFEVVQTAKNALLIEVHLENAIKLSTLRSESLTALKLAENENFALLSYQKAGENGYTTYLVNKNNVTVKPDYKIDYAEAKTAYAVSGVTLSKYPRLNAPALTPLTRGEEVLVLGEIQGLERTYFIVQRGAELGYLPTSFLSDFEGKPTDSETVLIGEDGKAEDSVWRLVYILLGGVIVCILVDFLILRKKRED